MSQRLRVARHFFFRHLGSTQVLGLLCLLCVVVVVGVLAAHSDRALVRRSYAQYRDGEFVMPLAVPNGGTAHQIVWDTISYRQLHSSTALGGGLLPMRMVALWLAFLLPMVGLALSFNLVSGDIESGVMGSLLSLPISRRTLGLARLCGEGAALLLVLCLGLGGIALVSSNICRVGWSLEQLVRLAHFLVLVGLYTGIFYVLGAWISARTRSSAKALWIACLLVASLFLGSTAINHAVALRASDLGIPPRASSEVLRYLYRQRVAKGIVSSPDDLPESVSEYFENLSVYSQVLSERLGARYQRERWLAVISPAHLFLGMANQILQDHYPTATRVAYAPSRPLKPARLSTTWMSILPEFSWLVILLGAAVTAYARTLRQLEI